MLCSHLVKFKLHRIVKYVKYIINISPFMKSHIFKGDNWHIFTFEKSFNVGIFSDTIKARSFQLYTRDYNLIWSLYSLSGFDGLDLVLQECQKYELQITCF